MPQKTSSLSLYLKPKMIAIAFLGLASGMPLVMTASTMSAWLNNSGVDKTAIGLFALLGLPYTLKFLWAPLVDHLSIPVITKKLGRRRSWIILTEIILIALIFGLGFTNPAQNISLTAIIALLITITSATHDIAVDAWRVEILKKDEQGAGAASIVFGYNIGMRLVGGALALYLSDLIGWPYVYAIMAVVMLVGIIAVIIAGEPKREKHEYPETMEKWIEMAVLKPLTDFMKKNDWILILLFVAFYKFGDAFAGVMTTPFLQDIGFSNKELAEYLKIYGLAATIMGTFIGGVMVHKIGSIKSLWICGFLQMLSNLMFVAQAQAGHDPSLLIATISIENMSGGMGTAAFIAYISNLCSRDYTATQYALLSSLAAIGRTVLSSSSGKFVEIFGWREFFIISTIAAVPGLVLLYFIGSRIRHSASRKK